MKREYVCLCPSATVLLAAVFAVSHRIPIVAWIPMAVYFGCALLLMTPLPGEEGSWMRTRMYVFLSVGFILGAPLPAWFVPFCSLSLCADIFFRLRFKMRRVRKLFRSDEILHSVLDLTNGLYILWLVAVSSIPVWSWPVALPVVLLQVAVAGLAVRLRLKERTVLLNDRQIRVMRTIARTNLRDPQEYDGSVENRKMTALYKRAVEHMEERKPFLDEGFDLEEFARKLFTNKVYLSRTINALSGRNFRQFVNYYRVRYSTELARKDPRLKVEELAMMSGFHTVVSYNMAFRLFMNETPSEWLHRYRVSLRS